MRARGNFTRRPTHQPISPPTCFSATKLPNLFTADGDHNLKIDFKVCRALFTPIKITHAPLPGGIYRGAQFCSRLLELTINLRANRLIAQLATHSGSKLLTTLNTLFWTATTNLIYTLISECPYFLTEPNKLFNLRTIHPCLDKSIDRPSNGLFFCKIYQNKNQSPFYSE